MQYGTTRVFRFLLGMLLGTSAAFATLPRANAQPRSVKADDIRVVARHGRSWRGTVGRYPVLVLRGSHSERGLAMGVLCAREIIRGGNEYVIPSGAHGAELYRRMQLPLVAKFDWSDRYRQELKGVLAGIEIALPKPADRKLSRLDRAIEFRDLQAGNVVADLSGVKCSSMMAQGAATADGKPVIARNLDFYCNPAMLASQCIVAVEPNEPGLRATLGVSWMGLVGCYTAVSDRGVFLAMHNARGLPRRMGKWRPRSFALRDALESACGASAIADITAVLRRRPVVCGNNILVGSAGAGEPVEGKSPLAAVLEWDGGAAEKGVTIRRPADGDPTIVCTNHYLLRRKDAGPAGSVSRYKTLAAWSRSCAGGKATFDFETARKAISSVAKGYTAHSVIAWPADRKLAVALSARPGSSAVRNKWVTVDLKTLLKVESGR